MTIKEKIRELMQEGVNLTADEIAGALDLRVLSVRPRVCELVAEGLLHAIGTKRNRYQNTLTVWTRTKDV